MTREQSKMSELLDEKASPLLYNLLREAPAHLQNSARMPLTSLEDVITLFDAQGENKDSSYLP